jgi:hypothetical protein
MRVFEEEGRLVIAAGVQQVWIEAWGLNSLRGRMTAQPRMD